MCQFFFQVLLKLLLNRQLHNHSDTRDVYKHMKMYMSLKLKTGTHYIHTMITSLHKYILIQETKNVRGHREMYMAPLNKGAIRVALASLFHFFLRGKNEKVKNCNSQDYCPKTNLPQIHQCLSLVRSRHISSFSSSPNIVKGLLKTESL